MQSQVEIWATYIPSAQRTGKVFEVPASYLVPRIGAAFALAGALWFINPYLTWNKKPETLDPEFLEEAKRIGNVAQRVNGSPVFLNPFRNRIPGYITGPEDVKSALE